MITEDGLKRTQRRIREDRAFEKSVGHSRLIEWSRLPITIRVRRGFKVYNYKLKYGYVDDNAYLAYSEESRSYGDKKVLMHYEESTLMNCISKAWRHLAENNVKLARKT